MRRGAAGTHESSSGKLRALMGEGRSELQQEGRSERRREREGGRTEPKTSPPRGSCRPDHEHRSVTRDAEARREPPKGLCRRDSQSITTAQKPPGQIAPERLWVCTCFVRYSAARLRPWGAGTGTRDWAGLRS